jgi:RHS repeat-associated protein
MGTVKGMRRLLLSAVWLLLLPTTSPAQVVQYYHLDAVGNVRVVTDQAGNVIERHDYLPFGEECTTGPCAANPGVGTGQPRKFTGKERDAETGLDYFGARYYASKIGSFTTPDPVYTWRENLLDPQRWSRYVYGRNNPLRYMDPDGRELRLTGTSANQSRVAAIANNVLVGQRLVIAADGKATFQAVRDNRAPPAQSAALAKVLGNVINNFGTT